jgi:hypothetical protein
MAPDSGFSTGAEALGAGATPGHLPGWRAVRICPHAQGAGNVRLMDVTTLRHSARAIAWGRVAIGITALVAPPVVTRPWVGPSADTTPAKLLARTLGGRDLALGLGTLRALSRSDEEARPWVALGGVSDAVDALATVVAFASLPRRTRWLMLGTCAGAALVSIRAAGGLDAGSHSVTDPASSTPPA